MISLLIFLILAALVYWVITQLPLPPIVKQVAVIILVVILVLWLVQFLGSSGGVSIPGLK